MIDHEQEPPDPASQAFLDAAVRISQSGRPVRERQLEIELEFCRLLLLNQQPGIDALYAIEDLIACGPAAIADELYCENSACWICKVRRATGNLYFENYFQARLEERGIFTEAREGHGFSVLDPK